MKQVDFRDNSTAVLVPASVIFFQWKHCQTPLWTCRPKTSCTILECGVNPWKKLGDRKQNFNFVKLNTDFEDPTQYSWLEQKLSFYPSQEQQKPLSTRRKGLTWFLVCACGWYLDSVRDALGWRLKGIYSGRINFWTKKNLNTKKLFGPKIFPDQIFLVLLFGFAPKFFLYHSFFWIKIWFGTLTLNILDHNFFWHK